MTKYNFTNYRANDRLYTKDKTVRKQISFENFCNELFDNYMINKLQIPLKL